MKDVLLLYEDLSYLDVYGGSVLVFVCLLVLLMLVLMYGFVRMNMNDVKMDWEGNRCKLYVMPFAGLIMDHPNVSVFDYTRQNFEYCNQKIAGKVVGEATKPLSLVHGQLLSLVSQFQVDVQNVRGQFAELRNSLINIVKEIINKLINVSVPLQVIVISMRDFISKLQGVMSSALFTVLGSYMTLKSLLGAVAEMLSKILIAMAATIAALWAVPATWGMAAANTGIYTAIAVPFGIMLQFMNKTMHIKTSGYRIPKLKCFDGNTIMKKKGGEVVCISEIKPGDELQYGGVVTSVIKVESEGSVMYNLCNVIVSDTHLVYYEGKWIRVKDHPFAVKLSVYSQPFLYCLNVSEKILTINGVVFSDWDEWVAPVEQFNPNWGNYGFTQNTLITLQNHTTIPIQKIKIGDTLLHGEHIYGIVHIIPTQTYTYPNQLHGNIPFLTPIHQHTTHKPLYNLLTHTGYINQLYDFNQNT